jgi:hypothetical protein
MADLPQLQDPPRPAHHLEGGDPFGFIDEQDAGDHIKILIFENFLYQDLEPD